MFVLMLSSTPHVRITLRDPSLVTIAKQTYFNREEIMKSILCAEPAHYEAPHNKTLEMAV